MTLDKTQIDGLYVIKQTLFTDERGYFTDIYNTDKLSELGISFNVDQISQAFNKSRNTLRGMHYQTEPHAQDKIVRCVKGRIFDVALDVRPNSPTFGKWEAIELTEGDNTMFYIPKGFAHGYQTLEDNTVVEYCVQGKYSPNNYVGVRWDDPAFAITWPLSNPILSEKDTAWPLSSSH